MNQHYGTFPEPETLRFERLVSGPIERVWDYLTKSDLKGKWLAAGDVEPRIGGKVEQRFHHQDLSEKDDSIPEKYKNMEDGSDLVGRVVNWDPPRLLSYTWPEGTGDESIVTFELFPKENNKVLLILTHQKLGGDRNMLIGVAAGWHTHLGILVDRLEGKKPNSFWKIHIKMEKEYEQRLGNK